MKKRNKKKETTRAPRRGLYHAFISPLKPQGFHCCKFFYGITSLPPTHGQTFGRQRRTSAKVNRKKGDHWACMMFNTQTDSQLKKLVRVFIFHLRERRTKLTKRTTARRFKFVVGNTFPVLHPFQLGSFP